MHCEANCDRRIRSPKSRFLARVGASGCFCDLQDFRASRVFVSSAVYWRVLASGWRAVAAHSVALRRAGTGRAMLRARGRDSLASPSPFRSPLRLLESIDLDVPSLERVVLGP